MENFDIVKYLRENHLGSHAILGNYVDLHALKEVEDTEDLEVVKGFGALKDKSVADKYAEVCKQAGMEGVKVVEKDGVFKIYAKAGQKLNKEADYGNNEPVDQVPYVGAEKKLDGFGDEFDQVAPVEEMDNSMTGDKGWQYDDEDFFPERDKLDRMLGLSHEYIGKVSPIVRKTINSLRADGFDDQDIIDFLATDLSTLEEEVTVSSSGVAEMEEALSYEDLENDLNKIAIKMRKVATLTHNNAGDFTFVNITADDDDDPAYNKKVQNAGYKEVVDLIKKKYPTLKVIEKEQNFDKVSFVIARK
jgi:hypothetical protein